MTETSALVQSATDSKQNAIRPAELPRSVSRTSSEKRLKRSTFLGYLLYLQRLNKLSEDQERYLLKLQSQVKFEELQHAISLLEGLVLSPRSAARAKQDLREVLERCPRLPAKSTLPEQRRIGVGYRDKGSLRPKHKPRAEAPRMWWSDDLPWLPINLTPEEPRWITAEELFGPERYDPIVELSMRAYLGQNPLYQFLSDPRGL